MTKKEKDLVIKDLCARLPYDVIVDYAHNAYNVHKGYYIKHDSKCILSCYLLDVFISPRLNEEGEYIKPYLFPLSSMTEEQQINLTKFVANGIHDENILYDWYNKNHFDYRGLIEKGLAIDATNLNIYRLNYDTGK